MSRRCYKARLMLRGRNDAPVLLRSATALLRDVAVHWRMLFLITALFTAQLTSLQHQVWHIGVAAISADEVARMGPSDSQDPRSNPLCLLHEALSTVVGIQSGTAGLPTLAALHDCPVPTPAFQSAAIAAPEPASRGPPALPLK